MTRLELWDNKLKGVLPAALAKLTDLKVLDLSKNHLTGSLPAELIIRANDNSLDLHFWGSEISELLTKVSIRLDNFIGICYPDMELQFAAEIDGPAGKAVYQSAHCETSTRTKRTAYCLKRELLAPPLDDVSRALRRLDFGSAGSRSRYNSPGGVSHHEEDLRTAITWGNGLSQVVWRSGGQAPLNVWTGQQLLLGLVPTNWERGAQRVPCET